MTDPRDDSPRPAGGVLFAAPRGVVREGRRDGRGQAVDWLPTPRRGGGAWAFLLGIATVGALAHVGVRFKGLEVAYALGRERKISTELEEQRRRLQIEIGMLKDPNRVVSIARDQLAMGPPAPEAIRRLGAGRLFVPPSATPGPGAMAVSVAGSGSRSGSGWSAGSPPNLPGAGRGAR